MTRPRRRRGTAQQDAGLPPVPKATGAALPPTTGGGGGSDDSAQPPFRQLLPAVGWWAIYYTGDSDGGDVERIPLVGWALIGAREVVGLDASEWYGIGGPEGVAPCPSRSAVLLGYAHENQTPFFEEDNYWLDMGADRTRAGGHGVSSTSPMPPAPLRSGA